MFIQRQSSHAAVNIPVQLVSYLQEVFCRFVSLGGALSAVRAQCNYLGV